MRWMGPCLGCPQEGSDLWQERCLDRASKTIQSLKAPALGRQRLCDTCEPLEEVALSSGLGK